LDAYREIDRGFGVLRTLRALDAEDLPFRNGGGRLFISLRLQAQIFDRTAETQMPLLWIIVLMPGRRV
jgi:hypothetical protein